MSASPQHEVRNRPHTGPTWRRARWATVAAILIAVAVAITLIAIYAGGGSGGTGGGY
jgi:hypothetical protein